MQQSTDYRIHGPEKHVQIVKMHIYTKTNDCYTFAGKSAFFEHVISYYTQSRCNLDLRRFDLTI